MNQPPVRFVRLSLTRSQAEKSGLADRWDLAARKIITRQQRRRDSAARLQTLTATLLTIAGEQSEPWSQRQLAKRIGLSWPTWLRCRRGQVNARRWLPRLEAALAKLQPS